MGSFSLDLSKIRERSRRHMEQGAVTENYRANQEQVIKILNESLATELVCVLRYKSHYQMAQGINSKSVAAEFLEHAKEEENHADLIAKRIVQLDGKPNFNPDGLSSRSHSQFDASEDLVTMIKEDLVAERIAIDTYSEIIRYLGEDDPTTRRMFEYILGQEEEHAEDLASLLGELEPARDSSLKIFKK
jgi:bacterioferritin